MAMPPILKEADREIKKNAGLFSKEIALAPITLYIDKLPVGKYFL
jgi:hypothetical protein